MMLNKVWGTDGTMAPPKDAKIVAKLKRYEPVFVPATEAPEATITLQKRSNSNQNWKDETIHPGTTTFKAGDTVVFRWKKGKDDEAVLYINGHTFDVDWSKAVPDDNGISIYIDLVIPNDGILNIQAEGTGNADIIWWNEINLKEGATNQFPVQPDHYEYRPDTNFDGGNVELTGDHWSKTVTITDTVADNGQLYKYYFVEQTSLCENVETGTLTYHEMDENEQGVYKSVGYTDTEKSLTIKNVPPVHRQLRVKKKWVGGDPVEDVTISMVIKRLKLVEDDNTNRLTISDVGSHYPDELDRSPITFTISGRRIASPIIVNYSDFSNGSYTIPNLPVGTYTVTKNHASVPDYVTPDDQEKTIKVKSDEPSSASFEPTTYKEVEKGYIKISDGGANITVPENIITFTIKGPDSEWTVDYAKDFSGGVYTSGKIPVGSYTVTKNARGVDGYKTLNPNSWSLGPKTVIKDGTTEFGFSNINYETAPIGYIKIVGRASGLPEGAEYPIKYKISKDGTVLKEYTYKQVEEMGFEIPVSSEGNNYYTVTKICEEYLGYITPNSNITAANNVNSNQHPEFQLGDSRYKNTVSVQVIMKNGNPENVYDQSEKPDYYVTKFEFSPDTKIHIAYSNVKDNNGNIVTPGCAIYTDGGSNSNGGYNWQYGKYENYNANGFDYQLTTTDIIIAIGQESQYKPTVNITEVSLQSLLWFLRPRTVYADSNVDINTMTPMPSFPEPPEGFMYVNDKVSDDSGVAEWSKTVSFTGNTWETILTDSDIILDYNLDVDGDGAAEKQYYLYYIAEVNERNLPDGWTCTIDTNGDNLLTTVGDTNQLTVTNTKKEEHTASITIKKYDSSSPATNKTYLADARFQLKKGSAVPEGLTYTKNGTTTTIEVDEGKFTVPTEGITISGLAPGDYTLTEISAPFGYVVNGGATTFTVETDGTVKKDDQVVAENLLEIPNEPGAHLPATGGPGTKVYYTLGALLSILAALFLLTKGKEVI